VANCWENWRKRQTVATAIATVINCHRGGGSQSERLPAKPTISTRDIHIYGPNSIRDRESAINSAQTLVDCGWLIPLKAHRRDMHKWQVVRRPIVHPNVAT
jgi:hypothetical protein